MKNNQKTEPTVKSALNTLLVVIIAGLFLFSLIQFSLRLNENIETEKELLELRKTKTKLEIEILKKKNN